MKIFTHLVFDCRATVYIKHHPESQKVTIEVDSIAQERVIIDIPMLREVVTVNKDGTKSHT